MVNRFEERRKDYNNALEKLEESLKETSQDFDDTTMQVIIDGTLHRFEFTFELAWKALQEIMRLHSVEGTATGSPREILQLGYKIGFINDSEVWLLMLKKRNTSVHIYNEDEIDEMIMLIRDSFIPAFIVLRDMLVKKLDVVESDWV